MVHFYHHETGIFSGVVLTASDSSVIAQNTPTDHLPFDGEIESLHSQRVDVATGSLVPHTPEVSAEAESDRRRQVALVALRLAESSTLRALRELALGYDGARERLKVLDKQIIDLRAAIST